MPCDVVADGDEVLPKAQDVRYDAFLSEIVMERLEGVDSCRRVRESGVEAAMIAVTANGDGGWDAQSRRCWSRRRVRQGGRGEGVEGGCRGAAGDTAGGGGCPGELCLGWKGVLSQGRPMTSLGSTQR